MIRSALAATFLALGFATPAPAADDAKAVIAKGIAALGGESKLGAAKALRWKVDGKLIIEGNENDFTIKSTYQGVDHARTEFDGEVNGDVVQGLIVLDGNKGWRKFGAVDDLDADGLANERRNAYLQVVPVTLTPLLGAGFQVEAEKDEPVDGKPASVVKVTGPDGKTARLLFDKASGLPVKMTATVVGFGGEDYDQATTFKEYKDFGGIQKATKVDVMRDGAPFFKLTVREFQALDAAPGGTFAEPK